ncbi:MAG: hypothetical protein J4F39_16475, partial [Candidatus Latescibacteria bacterium]|nr:hypothetical protein [Candidatus Latescibacterota bacterium]
MDTYRLRRLLSRLIVRLGCFVLLWNCAGSDVDETPEPDDPPMQAASGPTVVNPNLAVADELGALSGMNKELADAVLKKRPFLNMEALHSVVATHMSHGEAE